VTAIVFFFLVWLDIYLSLANRNPIGFLIVPLAVLEIELFISASEEDYHGR